jgi:hypothetical protein
MLAAIMAMIHQTNIKTGSGSLLPERSIQASKPEVLVLDGMAFIFGSRLITRFGEFSN